MFDFLLVRLQFIIAAAISSTRFKGSDDWMKKIFEQKFFRSRINEGENSTRGVGT